MSSLQSYYFINEFWKWLIALSLYIYWSRASRMFWLHFCTWRASEQVFLSKAYEFQRRNFIGLSLVRESTKRLRLVPPNAKCVSAHAHFILFREKMATAAKQAKTEDKNGAENADEQAGMDAFDTVCFLTLFSN